MAEYTPSEDDVRAWCREGTGDYPDVMDAWITRFLARVRRDAAREALDGFERVCDKVADRFRAGDSKINVRQRERAAEFAAHYRDTHYPETED